jgi:hypothetical protein
VLTKIKEKQSEVFGESFQFAWSRKNGTNIEKGKLENASLRENRNETSKCKLEIEAIAE